MRVQGRCTSLWIPPRREKQNLRYAIGHLPLTNYHELGVTEFRCVSGRTLATHSDRIYIPAWQSQLLERRFTPVTGDVYVGILTNKEYRIHAGPSRKLTLIPSRQPADLSAAKQPWIVQI